MDGAYAAALPLALGASVSPGLLAFELLILASERQPKARAWSYLLGVLTVIALFTVVGLAAIQAVTDAVGGLPTPWGLVIRLVLAAVFVAMGLAYVRPQAAGAGDLLTRAETRLRAAGLPAFYAFGVLTMMTNWSTLILYLTAIDLVRGTADPVLVQLVAALFVLIVTIAPLLLPVLAVTLVGHRSDALLARMAAFTAAYNRPINAGICFLVAAIFLWSAIRVVG